MDNKEVALELLKLYLQNQRERLDLEHIVEAYLAILAALDGGFGTGQRTEAKEEEKESKPEDDNLFDFKEPLSLSDKSAD